MHRLVQIEYSFDHHCNNINKLKGRSVYSGDKFGPCETNFQLSLFKKGFSPVRAILKAYSCIVQVYSKKYTKGWNFFPEKAQGLKNRHRKISLPSSPICAKPLCGLPWELESAALAVHPLRKGRLWPQHSILRSCVPWLLEEKLHRALACKKSSVEFYTVPEHTKKDWQICHLWGWEEQKMVQLIVWPVLYEVAEGWQWDIDLRLSHSHWSICVVWGPLLLKPCQHIVWLRHKPEQEEALDCSTSCSMWYKASSRHSF